MMLFIRSQIRCYGVATIAVALALLSMLMLNYWLKMNQTPFLLFFGAITISAWYGGLKPGLLATFLSAVVSGYFLIVPNFSLTLDFANFIRLSLFILQGIIISTVCEALHHSRRQAYLNLLRFSSIEERYRHIVETANEGIWRIDAHACTQYVNQKLAEMFGYTPEEMQSRPIFDFMDESVQMQARQHIELRKQGIKEQFDFCYRTKDGSQLWAIVSTNPILNHQGEFIGSLAMLTDITERKQAEKKLRYSEEQLRLVVESADLGMWDYNVEQDNLIWSERCKTMFGLNHNSNITYNNFFNFIHPADRERVKQTINHNIQTKENINIEYRTLWADGTIHWLQALGRIYYNESGENIRMAGVVLDVTNRKYIDLAFQASEARFANLVLNIPGVIYQYRQNREGHEEFPYMSADSVDLFEYENYQIQQNPQLVWNIVHRDDIEPLRESFTAYAGTGELWQHEWRIITPSGQNKWVQAFARSHRQPDESLLWDGVLLDITANKCSESRFRHIFDSNMIGMKFWGADNSIQQCNEAFLNLIGYSRDDVQTAKLKVTNITPPEYWQKQEQAAAEIRQRGVCTPYEKEYIHKDGSRIPVLVGSARLDDGSGGGICFVLDLSERKKLENQLRQQAEDLKRANLAKNEFLAVLSHELRTPLSSILGFTQSLRSGKLKENTIALALEAIERNARLQTQLIDDLLDVSKILQGKIRLNKHLINLVNVIETVIINLRPIAEQKSVNLEFFIDHREADNSEGIEKDYSNQLTTLNLNTHTQYHHHQQKTSDLNSQISINTNNQKLPTIPLTSTQDHQKRQFIVSADSQRLQQVISNLVANAIKFTHNGGKVEVRLSEVTINSPSEQNIDAYYQISDYQPAPTRIAQIQIIDNGAGINPEFLPYVFELFRQADSSITRQFSGLGLGLAIVRHIIDMHDGTVEAHSDGEGMGAIFTVKLKVDSNLV